VIKVISWGKAEIDISNQMHNVDVTELEFFECDKDKDGKQIQRNQVKFVPVIDLTNSEMLMLQSDPVLKNYSGNISDSASAKTQVYGLIVTYQRMYKANQNLGFTVHDMLKWSTTKSSKLIGLIKDELEGVQKKLKSSQSPSKDKI